MSLMVSISGVRGIVGTSLLPDTVVRYAAAFGEYCRRAGAQRPLVVIGRDGRPTGSGYAHIASSTLLAAGCDVLALGVAPTPTVALAVEREGAAGGIAVTASHNPAEWNGLKFIGPSGLFLTAAENRVLWDIVRDGDVRFAPWDAQGAHRSDPGWLTRHCDMLLGLSLLDADVIRARRFRVVLDCVNASGSTVVPRLLERLGCTVIPLYCDGSGRFPHAPEPVPANLTELAARVPAERADLGLAVDPDGDRLVLITERGEPYGEEYTIATAVAFVLGRHARTGGGAPPPVVVNLSTTRAVEDIAARHGARVVRTPVGEINVAQRMRSEGSLIGGEGSGGVILPALHTGRDALAGIALILQMLAEHGGTLSALKDSLPRYEIAKGKVDLASGSAPAILERLAGAARAAGARITADDGLKLDFDDHWVHLRASNTEPIMRIIAEAATAARAQELVDRYTALAIAPG
jgi:phosphomannomutase